MKFTVWYDGYKGNKLLTIEGPVSLQLVRETLGPGAPYLFECTDSDARNPKAEGYVKYLVASRSHFLDMIPVYREKLEKAGHTLELPRWKGFSSA